MGKMRDLRISEKITNRTKAVERYLSDISGEKMLTMDQEYAVACKIKEGDQDAIDTLVRANLRFVVSAAKQYSSSGVLLEELIAQGNIGLIDAAKTFDPTRGFKFISYAVWHIRKEIMKYLQDLNRTVRLPLNVMQDLNRAKKAESQLLTQLDREATNDEISSQLERMGYYVTPEKVGAIRVFGEKSIPLDSGDIEETFSPIHWLESGDDASGLLKNSERKEIINALFNVLTPMEADVVRRYLGIPGGDPQSFISIGDYHGKSGEWARGIYSRSLRKIKFAATRLKLREDLLLD